MDAVQIAALVEQLLMLGIQIYKQVESDPSVSVKPLADILSTADADFTTIATTAQNEINAAE